MGVAESLPSWAHRACSVMQKEGQTRRYGLILYELKYMLVTVRVVNSHKGCVTNRGAGDAAVPLWEFRSCRSANALIQGLRRDCSSGTWNGMTRVDHCSRFKKACVKLLCALTPFTLQGTCECFWCSCCSALGPQCTKVRQPQALFPRIREAPPLRALRMAHVSHRP